jgi:hypothetical protein
MASANDSPQARPDQRTRADTGPPVPRGRGRPPAVEPREVHHDITVVDGPAGKRLAAVQAQAILDVMTWWREHTSHPEPQSDE